MYVIIYETLVLIKTKHFMQTPKYVNINTSQAKASPTKPTDGGIFYKKNYTYQNFM